MFSTSILHPHPRPRSRSVIVTPLLLALALLLVSSLAILSAARPSAAHAATGFVTRSGTQFMLNGAPFEVVGSNNYYPEYEPQQMVDDLFSNAQAMGLTTMRVWAFLDIGSLDGSRSSIDGTKNGIYFQYWSSSTNAPVVNTGATGLQMLDYVIASAQAHNIKLILPFINNWNAFGGIKVVPLVGPSSILLALMASGLNGQSFAFHGYLPVDANERAKKLRELEQHSRKAKQTQIFIETPYRNRTMLDAVLAACAPSTLVCVAADLTLPTETIQSRPVSEWKKQPGPDLHKRPAIFLLLAV